MERNKDWGHLGVMETSYWGAGEWRKCMVNKDCLVTETRSFSGKKVVFKSSLLSDADTFANVGFLY